MNKLKVTALIVTLIGSIIGVLYKTYDIGYDMGRTTAFLEARDEMKPEVDKLTKQLRKCKKELKQK